MKFSGFICIAMMFILFSAHSQNVGISESSITPDASAVLELQSVERGFLVPRMTAVQRLAISNPANGLMVFDTDSACFLFYRASSTQWINLCNPGSGSSTSSGTQDDLIFPDGTAGMIPLTINSILSIPYTVPAGKNFYITSVYSGSANNYLTINGNVVYRGFANFGSASRIINITNPLIAGSAQTISSNDNQFTINGFLVDAGVEPYTLSGLSSSPFVVPAGKVFVILNYYSLANNPLVINGEIMYYGYSNFGDNTNNYDQVRRVIVAGPGQMISSDVNTVVVNGYLRDQ